MFLKYKIYKKMALGLDYMFTRCRHEEKNGRVFVTGYQEFTSTSNLLNRAKKITDLWHHQGFHFHLAPFKIAPFRNCFQIPPVEVTVSCGSDGFMWRQRRFVTFLCRFHFPTFNRHRMNSLNDKRGNQEANEN